MTAFNPYYSPQEEPTTQEYQGNKFGDYASAGLMMTNGLVSGIGGGIDLNQQLSAPSDYYNNMEFQAADTEINGIPVYSGVSRLNSEYQAIDPSTAGDGLIGQGVLGGLKVGASVGAGIGAGIGALGSAGILSAPLGLIGGAIGAIGGAIGGLFGGKKKKEQAKEAAQKAKEKATKAFQVGQENYNEDVVDYFSGVDTRRKDIQSQENYSRRAYGLNQYRDPFRSIL